MKLATELYDSDDAAPSRTPPLVRRDVKLQLSPSPEYPTPPPRSPTPELSSTSKRRVRKRRTQPSQSDGVLIGVLGGLNNPDIATRAAESPLNSASQSEAGDYDMAMEEAEDGEAVTGRTLLAQVAQDAIEVGGHGEARSRSCSPRTEGIRRVRPPKLQTLALDSQLRRPGSSGYATIKEQGRVSKERSLPQNPAIDESDPVKLEKKPPDAHSPSSSHEDSQLGRNGSGSTISPKLRKHTIAPSEGSPMETLPAIQHSPNPQLGKSPNNQQSLPSLQHLALPLDARSPKDNDLRSLGMNQRHTFPMQSPSTGPLTSRATFPSPQTRMNGHFPHPYLPTQPSPASTFNETSPGETYRHSQDGTSISPRGKPERHFYTSGRTPQSDELTPVSSESYQSTTSSVDTPLSAENMSADGPRPILPPLVSGPYVGGGFRCEFPGCTAVPFQTQYLLK